MFSNQFLSLAFFLFGLVDNAELENPQAPQSCEPVETLIKVTHYYGTLKSGLSAFFTAELTEKKKRLYASLSYKVILHSLGPSVATTTCS